MKRAQFSQICTVLSKANPKTIKAVAAPYVEKLARHFIEQKNDLYYIEFLNSFRGSLAQFSEPFQTFLFEVIDKRIMLLHRNLPGLVTTAESLREIGGIRSEVWRSFEHFLSSQIAGLTLNNSNTDLLIIMAEILLSQVGDLSPEFSASLTQYFVKYLKDQKVGQESVKELEKIALIQAHLVKEEERLEV